MNRKISRFRRWDSTSSILLFMIYALFFTLPLVWMRFLDTTIAPYHLWAAVLILAVPFFSGATSKIRDVLSTGKYLWISGVIIIIAMALSYTKTKWIFEPLYFLKFTFFFTTTFAVAVVTLLLIRRGLVRWLAFVPLAAGVVFLILISNAFLEANIDPLMSLQLAIQRADPNMIMQRVIRATFAASSNEAFIARATLKTILGLSFLPMIPVGILGFLHLKKKRALPRAWCLMGVLLTLILAVFPFSRSVWLALTMMALCYAFMMVRTANGLAFLLASLLVGVPILSFVFSDSDIVRLVDARLESEDSINARVHASEEHWEAIGRSPIFGSSGSFSDWSHNVMLDSWSAFGVIGLAGSVLLFLTILGFIIIALLRGISSPRSERAVHCSIAALMCPALVRMVTVPNVTIDFPVWIGIGIAIAVAADAWAGDILKPKQFPRRSF